MFNANNLEYLATNICAYTTDDSLATVLAPGYFKREYESSSPEPDDLIIIFASDANSLALVTVSTNNEVVLDTDITSGGSGTAYNGDNLLVTDPTQPTQPANSIPANTALDNLNKKGLKTQSSFINISNNQGSIDGSKPSGSIFLVPVGIGNSDITIQLPVMVDGYELTIKNYSFGNNIIITPAASESNIRIDGYLNSYSFINPKPPYGNGFSLNSVTLVGEVDAGNNKNWVVKNQTLDGDRTIVVNPFDPANFYSLNVTLAAIKTAIDAVGGNPAVVQVTNTNYNLTYNASVPSGSVYKFTNNANVILSLADITTFPDGHIIRIKSFLNAPADSFLIQAFTGDTIDDQTSFQLIQGGFLLPALTLQLDKTNKIWLIV